MFGTFLLKGIRVNTGKNNGMDEIGMVTAISGP